MALLLQLSLSEVFAILLRKKLRRQSESGSQENAETDRRKSQLDGDFRTKRCHRMSAGPNSFRDIYMTFVMYVGRPEQFSGHLHDF